MASPTKVYMTRVYLKTRQAARRRKNRLAKYGSTPTRASVFGSDSPPAPPGAKQG